MLQDLIEILTKITDGAIPVEELGEKQGFSARSEIDHRYLREAKRVLRKFKKEKLWKKPDEKPEVTRGIHLIQIQINHSGYQHCVPAIWNIDHWDLIQDERFPKIVMEWTLLGWFDHPAFDLK